MGDGKPDRARKQNDPGETNNGRPDLLTEDNSEESVHGPFMEWRSKVSISSYSP